MEDNTLNELFYGSMLHDIGKILQRAGAPFIEHSKLGKEYLRRFTSNKRILHQIRYHHSKQIRSSLPDNDLAFITYIADNIASGIDRRNQTEDLDYGFERDSNLEDIFNRFGEQPIKRYIQPSMLGNNNKRILPATNKLKFTPGDYSGIKLEIESGLRAIKFEEDYRQSMLNLFEATASFIPSSTQTQEVADISLYDHMRLTAGIAEAIYLYLDDQGIDNYRKELYKSTKQFYGKSAFQLVSFDISGIQRFIYTITTAGAYKQLRSRSFYVDMISEWIVDSLLNKLNLTRANLIYSGGGHAYMLLPNTTSTVNAVEEIEKSFNSFFLKHFGTDLYVAFGNIAFTAADFMVSKTSNFEHLYESVSHQIIDKKLHRYDAATIMQLNVHGKRTGRECIICHTVDNLVDGENKCQLCESLEEFSNDLQKERFFLVDDNDHGLPIGPGKYIHPIKEQEILKDNFDGFIYSKNAFNTGYKQATRLLVGDYAYFNNNELKSYSDREWAQDSNGKVTGIKKIAAFRCDVDDLGYAFMKGFSLQNDGAYNTFSRTATFSRRMSIFFKSYINDMSKNQKLMLIYSGGDDVFLLGAWDDVIDFAVDFREHFKRWTGGKLTLSAGIGLFDAKTPINIIARKTGELATNAKRNGKDSISIFDESNTYDWDTFTNDVYIDKLDVIRNFFDNQSDHGKAFIYRLLELIRSRDENDRISFARIAYTLARMEDDLKKAESVEAYKEFRQKLMNWFEDTNQIKQAELALMLYVYETRKEP